MICPYCGSDKTKRDGLWDGRQRYKCTKCGRKHTKGSKLRSKPREVEKIIRDCLNCGKPTENPSFCSRSCSTTYNNIHFPKRKKKKRFCKYCGADVEGRRVACDDCNPNLLDWDNITLGEVIGKASYQVAARVRQLARVRYRKSKRPKYCINCGYKKHYEVCHVQAIMDFPPETPVTEINQLKNLVALCPTCHWELDNDLLTIEEIRAKNDAIL